MSRDMQHLDIKRVTDRHPHFKVKKLADRAAHAKQLLAAGQFPDGMLAEPGSTRAGARAAMAAWPPGPWAWISCRTSSSAREQSGRASRRHRNHRTRGLEVTALVVTCSERGAVTTSGIAAEPDG